MAKVKGQNLRLFMDNGSGNQVAIAAAQQCDLNIRLNVKQVTTKDDEDDFATQIAVGLSWTVRSRGVVTSDPDRNDPASLMSRVGQTVMCQFALSSGTKNSVADDVVLAGQATITDVQVTAQNREEATYEVLLTGRKNILFPMRVLCSNEPHMLITSDGHCLTVQHDEV